MLDQTARARARGLHHDFCSKPARILDEKSRPRPVAGVAALAVSGFARCETVITFGRLCSPTANLPSLLAHFWCLLDELWTIGIPGNCLSPFGVYTGIIHAGKNARLDPSKSERPTEAEACDAHP